MTDRGLKSWTDGLSARKRVGRIVTTLAQPRSVEWVREEAQVSSWQTAKGELELLVESGEIRAVEDDDGQKYMPNYQLRHDNEVTELINEYTRDELREELADIEARIDELDPEDGVVFERLEDNKRLLMDALDSTD